MVAKLISGQLVQAPDKVTIANPEESLLKVYLGYKEYTEDPQPEYDPETQRLSVTYEETDTTITKHYTVADLPKAEPVSGYSEEVETDV
mgnify:FL=1